MQCMLKGVCAQCLQWQIDPETKQRTKAVFACSWPDQPLELIDFDNVDERQIQNKLQEQLSQLWVEHLFKQYDIQKYNEEFMFGEIIQLINNAENELSDDSITKLLQYCSNFRCRKPEDQGPSDEVYPRVMHLADKLYCTNQFILAYGVYNLALRFIANHDHYKWSAGYFRMMCTALKFSPKYVNLNAQNLSV